MPAARQEWLKLTVEAPLDPRLPICDPHHHFWDRPEERYFLVPMGTDTYESIDTQRKSPSAQGYSVPHPSGSGIRRTTRVGLERSPSGRRPSSRSSRMCTGHCGMIRSGPRRRATMATREPPARRRGRRSGRRWSRMGSNSLRLCASSLGSHGLGIPEGTATTSEQSCFPTNTLSEGCVNTCHFGDVRVDRILEFERPLLPPQQLFPTSTSDAIDRHRHWLEPRLLDPSGLLVIAFHSFLIRSNGLTILVDTCGGNDKPRPQKLRYHMGRWPYLENLARIGIAPEEVDYVLCTHLHVDHVGWNTRLVGGAMGADISQSEIPVRPIGVGLLAGAL